MIVTWIGLMFCFNTRNEVANSFDIFVKTLCHFGVSIPKYRFLENKLLLISINFTPKTSHSCLKKRYTRFSRLPLFKNSENAKKMQTIYHLLDGSQLLLKPKIARILEVYLEDHPRTDVSG